MLTSEALAILHLRAPYDLVSLKVAYRAQLLARHPDKQSLHLQRDESGMTVQDVKAAYVLLSTLYAQESRARGDKIVDLDEFHYNEEKCSYSLECRCGHAYTVTEDDLEAGRDVIGCHGCSLYIRVAYEENLENE